MVEQIPKIRIRRFLLIFLLVILAAAAALFLIARENLYGMLNALRSANYLLALTALIIYVVNTIILSLRWRLALSTAGYKVQVQDMFLTIYAGIFINNVTPFTYSGGDPIGRSYLLNKTQKVPFASSFAAIISEYLLDTPVYLSFVAFGLAISLGLAPIWGVALSLGILILLTVLILSIFSSAAQNKFASKRVGGFIARLTKFVKKRISTRKIAGGISRFYTDAQAVINRRTIVVVMTALSALLWAFSVLRLFIIFRALSYVPSLSMITLGATVPWIVGLAPLLPGGLGTVDFALVSIFMVFGAPFEIALSAALIERAISFVFSTLTGAGALSYLTFKVLSRKPARQKKNY